MECNRVRRPRLARLGGVLASVSALMVLAGGCAAGGPAVAGSAGRPMSPSSLRPAASAVSAAQLKALAARYLAIAVPANRRLDTEVDGYTDDERDDLGAAEADLRAEAATERLFDQHLTEIPFPPGIAEMVQALVRVNQVRATLADQQARSASIAELLSFNSQHRAFDAAVEVEVRLIRRALSLPPPDTS